jgi:phospholipase C
VNPLDRIDHVVVLMMENRSFDHMLGYLKLTGANPDVDGLTGTERNDLDGRSYKPERLGNTRFLIDPCHGKACVEEQLSDGNGGFVRSYAERDPQEPGLIMGYYDGAQLPVYDHLAGEFTVCDRWFASVPGPTWPNRLYSLAGNSDGEGDAPRRVKLPKVQVTWRNLFGLRILPHVQISLSVRLPSYRMKTVFEHLDDAGTNWTYFDHDIAFLRVFRRFRYEIGQIDGIGSFFERCRSGELPSVSWIDPNFADVGRHASDDHPPADVLFGQQLVGSVYNALLSGGQKLWSKTLLVITYDEHGGFYDHVTPPEVEDERPEFRRLGVRVPALVVSPWVGRGHVDHMTFDHTSIVKTILTRFCTGPDGSIPTMGRRVDFAQSLAGLLTETVARTDATPAPPVMMPEGLAPPGERTDLQELMADLREDVVAGGVPPERT